MKDASETPRAFKRYHVSSDELKAALGIDWPGAILSVSGISYAGFTITMSRQPHELTGTERERYTEDAVIPVPTREPLVPAKPARKPRRWSL